jgi:hypothetical protein
MPSPRKRLQQANRRILRQLKEVEGLTKKRRPVFDMRKMFEHTFGRKPYGDIFMQKTRGGVIFYVGKQDYVLLTEEYALPLSSGRALIRKPVKTRSLKSRVILVRSDLNKEELSRTAEHEKLHLLGHYHNINSNGFRKLVEREMKTELIYYLKKGYSVDSLDFEELAYDYYRPFKTRAKRGKTRAFGIASEIHADAIPTMMSIRGARREGIPMEQIIRTIKRSSWKDVAKNLNKLREKAKK